MRVMCPEDNIESVVGVNNIYIRHRYDILGAPVRRALTKANEEELAVLVDILNKINNQGILKINGRLLTYDTVNAKDLDIDLFCTAECLFTLVYFAKCGYYDVVIKDDIICLEKSTYKLLLSEFRDTNNVVIETSGVGRKNILLKLGGC